MSRISNEIIDRVKDLLQVSEDGSTLSALLGFDRSFVGFDGHFPDNPVLPGVVMIQVALTMARIHLKNELRLSQIKKAKFVQPVLADDPVIFEVMLGVGEAKEQLPLSAKVVKADKVIAKFSLFVEKESFSI